ncbi:MAG: TPR end-of-group domain-containing protein [Phycisphaerales bacterium]
MLMVREIIPRLLLVMTLLALVVPVATSAVAQNPEKSTPPAETAPVELDAETAKQLRGWHREAEQLYLAGKHGEALDLWKRILEVDPTDTIALYNSACAKVKLGDHEDAVKLIELAILNGFVDFEDLERDPDLDPIRDHPRIRLILDTIDEIMTEAFSEAAEYMQSWAGEVLGPDAIIERDDTHRFVYATNLDQTAHASMRRTIERQLEYQIDHLFGGPPNSYVLVLAPSPERADAMLQSVRIGGVYEHDKRRLITREIGPSLRHEITHAVHHAHMDRLNQRHPMWIQEGLAALFEFYEFDSSGEIRPLDNTRINIAINLARGAGLTDWREFFSADDRRFTQVRPRAKYAEARAIFQYLAEHEKLVEWYESYTDGYRDDPTGARAFEEVFGQDLDTIEREFRLWLRNREKAPERIREDEASLGVWVADQGANDGVLVVGLHDGGAARRSGLRSRDVITAIDGQPVYVVEEIIYEIARRHEGDTVTLRVRRGTRYDEITVELQPVKPLRHTVIVQEPGVAV